VKRKAFSTPIMSGEIMLAFSTREIVQSKRKIRVTSLFFSFLVFSIGIGIGFVLAKNISVPVLKLRDAATKVGRGDLTQRVDSNSRDEIGELGTAFNKMVTDLETTRQQLEARTSELIVEKRKTEDLLEGLQRTLADLRDTQEQLIRQEKLASIGQLTKGLVDRLLNPLSYVNNFSDVSTELLAECHELLAAPPYADDEHLQEEIVPLLAMVESNIGKIKQHGSSLTRIVRSMDKLLQVKSDHFVGVDLNAFVEEQLAAYRQELDEAYRSIPLELVKGDNPENTPVRMVPPEMGTVLFSLLNNAMYAVHEKALRNPSFRPALTVATVFQEDGVAIQVRDNGPGISAAEQEQLFSPFFTTKPTSKGTGLGLFISQDIVKTHKGHITVESRPDESTTFTISLPAATPVAVS
jgi:signal transduction histidine kinase